MKNTLYLPIFILALLALATGDAFTAPCDSQSTTLRTTLRTTQLQLDRTETALDVAEKTQSAHFWLDHFLVSASGNTSVTCAT